MTVKSPNSIVITYPRTGKRGVPQKFPRTLYAMLECESQTYSEQRNSPSLSSKQVIRWSASKLAFHITDISSFSKRILPKYFNTSKFSSFQRNLNLYGFSKVSRGPDTDTYAHRFFIRGCPEALSLLQRRKRWKGRTNDHNMIMKSSRKGNVHSRDQKKLDVGFMSSPVPSSLDSIVLLEDTLKRSIGNHQLQIANVIQLHEQLSNIGIGTCPLPNDVLWNDLNMPVEAPYSFLIKSPNQPETVQILYQEKTQRDLLALALQILELAGSKRHFFKQGSHHNILQPNSSSLRGPYYRKI